MYTHICIKPNCGNSYQDEETDAYYCESCLVEKERIAVEVDAKLANRSSRESKSMLQEYDEAPKGPGGFIRVSF